MDIDPCVTRKVKEFEDSFVPGTVLLNDKASYKLRVEYPMDYSFKSKYSRKLFF
jgi:hypothetical protein